MSIEVSRQAPGKVNLFFAVGDAQPNGYHPVASLYAAVSLYERVTVSESSLPGISQSVSISEDSPLSEMEQAGDFDLASVPLDERNLAYRAAMAVLDVQGISLDSVALHLHMEKAVPVAGGMGGGSADAAATLLAVNDFLKDSGAVETALSMERLLEVAASLGADVPFAVQGGIAVGLGIGDDLTAVDLPAEIEPLHLVLIPASFGLSTPAVFAELDRGRAAGEYPLPGELVVPVGLLDALQTFSQPRERAQKIARFIENDLAAPACTLAPELLDTLCIGEDRALVSFVSGSGPTIVFLMESADSAKNLEIELKKRHIFAVAVATLE
ncbi:4-diphosphocytidyl-2C-methyl-D-erythritol kinase [uncultured Rothia sp.]|uniref:GHMP family kinase ATP-binding protein n=1 Tax=uncultured Rothia sp. TaxID=316088 RepID=UPI0032178F56